VLHDLDPGRSFVLALPGTPDGPYRPSGAEVALAPGATTKTVLDLVAGGRLFVTVRAAAGPVAAAVRLEGGGAPLRGDGLAAPAGSGLLREFLRADAAPMSMLLAPGRYVVRIEPRDGRLGSAAVPVEVVAGETSTLEVTLDDRLGPAPLGR
ncbi:MAG: hypothetical protein ACE5JG_12440, partial [Planctomycetota bacterium]